MHCSCGQQNPIRQRHCIRCGRRLLLGMAAGRLLLDAGVAAGLALALAVVLLVDRGTQPAPAAGIAVESTAKAIGGIAAAPVGNAASTRRPLRLAVTPARPEYDDMGRLLSTLGEGYSYDAIPMDDLLHPGRLEPYDAVFVTCAGVPRNWVAKRLGSAERGSSGLFQGRPLVLERLKESLRSYVGRGGTLYASDWQFQILAIAFPEWVDTAQTAQGAAQTVSAEVVDPRLRKTLGDRIELHFDKAAWQGASFLPERVDTLLKGTYRTLDGEERTGPLLVHFPFEQGHVIFTSFHNEAQNTEMERDLLRYLVFTSVTARVEADVRQTLVRGGFSPVDRSLLSASRDARSTVGSYRCEGAEELQFVLGFEDRGARLQLEVADPAGRTVASKTGTRTLTVAVPRASAGQWRYTVTALDVPYENFPYTLTIGERN